METTMTILTKKGNKVELRLAEPYIKDMRPNRIDADGYIVNVGEELYEDGMIEATAPTMGVKVKGYFYSWKPYFAPKYQGWVVLGKILVDEKEKDKFVAWVEEIMEAGTTEAARKYEEEEARKELQKRVERAKAVIAKAEAQRDIPDQKEARRRMKVYNDVMNEGGDGYVPYIYSREEYEDAKRLVAEAKGGVE